MIYILACKLICIFDAYSYWESLWGFNKIIPLNEFCFARARKENGKRINMWFYFLLIIGPSAPKIKAFPIHQRYFINDAINLTKEMEITLIH